MKMKTLFQLIPVTFIAGGLFLGCGGESHDHHDHDHDGDGKPNHGPGELPKPTTETPDEGEEPKEPSETSEKTENGEKPAPTPQESSE